MPNSPDSRSDPRVYLDAAGSFPVLRSVAAAVAQVPDGNASSPHAEGRAVRSALDFARDLAARALGVATRELVFCASGTEAVNLALFGAARRLPRKGRIVTWGAEHQAVLGAVRELQLEGFDVSVLPVSATGFATPEAIPDDAALVSIGLANNELGTIQPVAEVAARAHAVGALVHVDMSQGPAWIGAPVEACDLASFSGAKIGAGGGGLLFARQDVRLQPLFYGGPQEWGRRAGREDARASVAIATALDECARRRSGESARVAPLAERLRDAIQALGATLTGAEPRLPNFATATVSRRRGEDMLLALDLAGVAASSGSACASGSLDPSHVLLALGMSLEEALGSLRLTLSYATTEADVSRAIEAVENLLAPAAGKRAG